MPSSTNERTIAARKKEADRLRQSDVAFIKQTMSHPQGRGWIWRHLGESRLFLAEDNLDHALLAYNAGQRNVGLRLLADLMLHCPDSFVQMFRENTGAKLQELQDEQEPSDD